MRARCDGMFDEIQLAKMTGLSRANARKHLCGREWHHVKHNGHVTKLFFGYMPEADELAEIKEKIKSEREPRGKCPACGQKKRVKTHCFYCGENYE